MLQYVAKELRGDKDVVLAAVKDDGMQYMYASEKLKADRDIIRESIMNTPLCIEIV